MSEDLIDAMFKRASGNNRALVNILSSTSVLSRLKEELRIDFSRACNKMVFDSSVRVELLIFSYQNRK